MAKKSSAGLLVGLVALAGGAFLLSGTATAETLPKPAPKPSGTPAPVPTPTPVVPPMPPASPLRPDGTCAFDPGVPAPLQAQVNNALASTTLTQASYEDLATKADAAGFPQTAQCLRLKGQQQMLAQQTQLEQLGGMPFVIQTGDTPYGLAKYYLGGYPTVAQVQEIGPPLNQIGTLQPDQNGVYNFPGWIPGTQVLIPKDWNPLAKPLPAVPQS